MTLHHHHHQTIFMGTLKRVQEIFITNNVSKW